MEYGINNEINYPTLQIRSILVWKRNEEKHKKDTDANHPGGMGKGLERAYSKNNFITAVKI